jgi:hypothetical protein
MVDPNACPVDLLPFEQVPDSKTPTLIYGRISKLKEDSEAILRQTNKSAEEIGRRKDLYGPVGWYADPDKSGFKRKVKRKGFDQMIADIKSGRYGSRVAVMVYAVDRFTRQCRQIEDLIDLIDEGRVRFLATEGFDSGDGIATTPRRAAVTQAAIGPSVTTRTGRSSSPTRPTSWWRRPPGLTRTSRLRASSGTGSGGDSRQRRAASGGRPPSGTSS